MTFEFFDPKDEVVIREGNLPHWFQPGVTYFITFRTEDSVPQQLVKSWYGRREEWLRANGIEPQASNWRTRLRAAPELDKKFSTIFTREFMEYLDRGLGECVLRDQKLAAVVASSFHHFDGQKYHLGDFIVMPNHVHLLVCLLGATEIEPMCESWKHFTARQINKELGRQGRFWQEESFDHLVRSAEQLEALERYIAENPAKSGTGEGDYLHYRRSKR